MGMFSTDHTRDVTCPRCGATATMSYTLDSRGTGGKTLTGCGVCGWHKTSRNPSPKERFSNATSGGYIIPDTASPRRGIRLLAKNAEISIPEAADVLSTDTDTSLDDVQPAPN